ncbi:DUF899 family protein [Cupriavidus taiwanensis]|uniref:DUF899 family protein n=1 Tax=Cupriavidus taiwanensis TaxID=164546 RepID=UPI000E1969EA|nr:DUF899 family protein [Cupriavidus taiwanensis]SOZ25052.1 conserved hypothetical protein [Cupriavidus taiwanensis]SPA30150.1 conserved hypothetical protein [Cupriavidus taiwanensis]
MEATSTLTPATELAQRNPVHFPNESAQYRKARNALLAEEIELRRHIERVAAQRRQLPPGGEVTRRYTFQGEHGPVTLEDLFGDKDTLVVYSYMFGPQRERPCPMCTSVMASWDHKVPDIEQRVALAMIARSPVERLLQAKQERGWTKLKVYADVDGAFTRDYVSPEDADVPGYSVFTRRDGKIRHFWSGEMYALTSDPGQDPRGAPDLDPLWTLLDTTPEGRGGDWYPQLEYGSSGSS